METAPYPLAFTAGVLAAVNPCGFALLPAYASMLIVNDGGTARRLSRALALAGAMTLGFLAVFGAFGLLAAPAAEWVADKLPWVTVVAGVLLACLGLWLAAGRDIPSPVPKLGRAPELTRSLGPMFLFGAFFAVASLGCTIGPFLLVVVTAFQAGSAAAGAGLFLAYAAGMALVVGTVAIAVALARHTVLGGLKRTGGVLSRIAGGLMLASGAYVAWYGWYEIRLAADASVTDPIVSAAGNLQTWLATQVESRGWLILAVTAALLASTAAWLRLRRKRAAAR